QPADLAGARFARRRDAKASATEKPPTVGVEAEREKNRRSAPCARIHRREKKIPHLFGCNDGPVRRGEPHASLDAPMAPDAYDISELCSVTFCERSAPLRRVAACARRGA